MGWLYGCYDRKSQIADLVKGWENETPNGTVKTYVLKHCYRGNAFSGVLWVVFERTIPNQSTERFIACFKLEYRGGLWGYKDMDESMGPHYYSCPLSYLDMTDPANGGDFINPCWDGKQCEEWSKNWREHVREHHARSLEKRRKKAALRKQFAA